MSALYESCAGCGAETPSERCFGCFHDFGCGLTAPSNANTSGLEVVGYRVTRPEWSYWRVCKVKPAGWDQQEEPLVTAASAQARIAELEALVASIRRAQRDVVRAEIEQEGYAPISDANDRAAAAEARADRLVKDTKGLLAEIASFGRAFMAAQESLAPTSTPDAYDDAILVASVRYQSVVKTASALYRAALQQKTQP